MRDLALRLRRPDSGSDSPRRLKQDLETILAGLMPKMFTGLVSVVPGIPAGGSFHLEIHLASKTTDLPSSVLAARLRHVAGLVRSKCLRKGWLEVPPEMDALAGDEASGAGVLQIDPGIFAGIYERDAHIRIITEAVRLAMRTNFRMRCHVLLYGPPACAKTEILKVFARVLAPHGVLSLDATATTKAGVERLLLDSATPPNFILAEEMEKKEEAAHQWLLSVMDQRGEISKINFNVGSVSKAVPALVIATVNDISLFERMLSGALASRFSHKLYCGRPDRTLLERILTREVQAIDGDQRWVAPALDYCLDVERTDDPRRAIAVCLTGRERLLTGEFQRDLEACRPEGRHDGEAEGPYAVPVSGTEVSEIEDADAPMPASPIGKVTNSVIGFHLIIGDALAEMAKLATGSVDCLVTSPPYYMLCRYGAGDAEIGWESTVDAYIERLVSVFREAKRLLRPTGTCWVNIGDSYGIGKAATGETVDRGAPRGSRVLIPERLAIALQSDGWLLRQHITWDRNCWRGRRGAKRPRDTHESILMLALRPDHYWQDSQDVQQAVWRIAPARLPRDQQIHPCPFPAELVRRCIQAGCPEGGVVMDPFVGSGTTLRVASELGRSAIGIDLKRFERTGS